MTSCETNAPASEASLSDLPLFLTKRWVTTQCDDVTDVSFLCSLERVVNFFLVHVGAGEVHVGWNARSLLHIGAQLDSQIGGSATGAPGEISEKRLLALHLVDAVVECLHPGCITRRVIPAKQRE